jgi:MoxR-like ATPase
MTTSEQPAGDLLSRLINEAVAPLQKYKKGKFSEFQKALATVIGVPATQISTVSVTDVGDTLDNRLKEWRHRTPVRIVILDTPTFDQVGAEVRRARKKVGSVVGQGNPPTRAVLIYARNAEGSTPMWTLRALFDSGPLGDLLELHYPCFSRTIVPGRSDDQRRADEDVARGAAELLPRDAQDSSPTYTVEQAVADLFCSPELFKRMHESLLRQKNIVLEGPPGVGKTYAARRLAQVIAVESGSQRIEMIQFHPSYSYEEFVRGSRDGAFVKFCRRASPDPRHRYVFIIDEINRGNPIEIFGELLMLIDADKRDARYAVPFEYSDSASAGRTFFVPPNVFVIALMNTADRSHGTVDYALRRRFAFIGLTPAFGSEGFTAHLKSRGAASALIQRIVRGMTDLNEIIAASPELGPEFAIGHGYFIPGADDEPIDDAWYTSVIDTQIVPLLRAYWSHDPSMLAKALAAIE